MDSPFTGVPLKGSAPRRKRRLCVIVSAVLAGCSLLGYFLFGSLSWGSAEPLHFPVAIAPRPDDVCPVGFHGGWKQDKGDGTCSQCSTLSLARDVRAGVV